MTPEEEFHIVFRVYKSFMQRMPNITIMYDYTKAPPIEHCKWNIISLLKDLIDESRTRI